MGNQIRNRLEYLKKHNLLDKHDVSASGSNALLCFLKDLENWLDDECVKCGAVDGYGYNSGVEYGLRKAAIEIKKRRELLGT